MAGQVLIAAAILAALWIPAVLILLRGGVGGSHSISPRDRRKLAHLQPGAAPADSRAWGNAFILLLFVVVLAGLVAPPERRVLTVGLIFGVPPAAFLIFLAIALRRARRDAAESLVYAPLNEGDPLAALRNAREAIETRGPSADRYNNLAVVLIGLKRWDEAIEALDDAARLEPKNAIHGANRSVALWRTGRIDEAIPLARDAVARFPLESVLRANYCQMLADAGRADEARSQLEALREILGVTRFHSDKVRELLEKELKNCEKAVAQLGTDAGAPARVPTVT